MFGTSNTECILEWHSTKKRLAAVQRPRKRWPDAAIKEIITMNGEDFEDVKELVQHCVAWTALVRGISTDRLQGL